MGHCKMKYFKSVSTCLVATMTGGLMLFAATTANAAVIDFESIPSGNCAFVGSPITTQGYTFTDTSGGGLFNCLSGTIHAGASSALIAANTQSSLTMEEEFASLFTLNGFDAGPRLQLSGGPANPAAGITVTGTKFDLTTIMETITFSGDFNSYSLSGDFSDLVSVNFLAIIGVGSEFLIDNIVVNEPSVVPVPAPATLAIFSLGLAGLGWSRRKKA